MKVAELFERLSLGEFSNLALGEEGNGTIPEKEHPKLIKHINSGLLRLFTRFNLLEKDILIEQVSHITNYHLRRRFAESSQSNEPYAYIKDLPHEQFNEDVLKILEVYNSHGEKLPLNDLDNPDSIFTPQPDTIQVPRPEEGISLAIVYQARHSKLLNTGEYLGQDIELPFYLEEALQNFVAHKVYSNMNGQENVLKSTEYASAFDTLCVEVERKDLASGSTHTSHNKLEKRGFV